MHLKNRLWNNYRFFDLGTNQSVSPLPPAPCDSEKYSYIKRHVTFLNVFSVFGFACVTLSAARLYGHATWMFPLYIMLGYTVIYFLVSLRISIFPKDFDLSAHRSLVRAWKELDAPSVDVFLPTCGEPLDVLANTWRGVLKAKNTYRGVMNVHCLDDAHCSDVRSMADAFGFKYYARPNKGWFKKAGNLRYGFENTSGDFIAIFDADFRPRHDFFDETLPYFDEDSRLGIVQSPQYFGFSEEQNWLERGAGAVQELFYRVLQTSRQTHDGAICVGSNAIYRRAALDDIGGTALIEHSEDVHTGFELRAKNWHLKYIPLVLARGLCPSDLGAFFKQQYRWCMGSMSLLASKKFWGADLPLNSRMCFVSGFMYYIHTALYSVLTPVVPLIMLFLIPEEIKVANYLLIFPSFLYMHVIFPLWHRKPYGIEAASVRVVYGWAHLIALFDKVLGSAMEWQPTGAVSKKRDYKYLSFRTGVIVFNFFPAVLWVGAALYQMIYVSTLDFLPIFILGIYYLFVILKIAVYRETPTAHAGEKSVPDRSIISLKKPSLIKSWIPGTARPALPLTGQAMAHQNRMSIGLKGKAFQSSRAPLLLLHRSQMPKPPEEFIGVHGFPIDNMFI